MNFRFTTEHAQHITDELLQEVESAPMDGTWSDDLRRRVADAMAPLEAALRQADRPVEPSGSDMTRTVHGGIQAAKAFLQA